MKTEHYRQTTADKGSINMSDDEWVLLLELRESQDYGAFAVACDGKIRRAAAHELTRLGYARWHGESWGYSFWAITDMGREAIIAEPSHA